jgi:hypothetical protein
MNNWDAYIGANVDEVMKKMASFDVIGFRTVRKCAEGDKYDGPKFEIVLIRYNKENQLVTRVGPPYRVK